MRQTQQTLSDEGNDVSKLEKLLDFLIRECVGMATVVKIGQA